MQLKKIFFTLLVVVIALTTLTFGAAAADATAADFTVSVSGTVNAAGEIVYAPGETIDVVIDVNNNPGIALLEVHIKYDATILAPVKDADGVVYETGAFLDEDHVTDFSKEGELVFKSQVKLNPKPIVDEDGNIIKSGEIAKFSFKVLDGAHADASSIKISDASALTSNYDSIKINTTNAKFAIHSLKTEKGTPATCTSTGKSDSIFCTECDYVVSAGEELPALNHPAENRESFGAVAGNCTTPAVTAGVKCTLCGTTLVEPVVGDSVAHVASGTWITVKEATHFEAGLKKQNCKNCGEVAVEETIAVKTEHEYDAGVTTTAPTCSAPGEITYTCPCGDKYTVNVAPIAHTYEDKVIAPTCTESGYTAHTCKVCGDYVEDTIVAAKGHTYTKVTKEATCTALGVTTYTCACGDTYNEVIDMIPHAFEDKVTTPTCTTMGYTTHTCTVCDYVLVDTYVDAAGHTVVEDKAVEPTCSEGGKTAGTHCSVCNAVLVPQTDIAQISLLWLWVQIGVVVVLVGAAVLTFFLLKKKGFFCK